MTSRNMINANTLLKVVAAECGVSEGMVSKMAKKLGFGGFRSLRTALVKRHCLQVEETDEGADNGLNVIVTNESICHSSFQTLRSTSGALSAEKLVRVAQSVCDAGQRDFYGVGGSAQVARDAAFRLLRIGVRASAFDEGCAMLMSATLLQKGDVAVAFSYSGQDQVVVEAAHIAHEHGAEVIAVTNHEDCALVRKADLALCTWVEHSSASAEGVLCLAQLSLLDTLIVAMAKICAARAEPSNARKLSVAKTSCLSWR